MNNKVEAMKPPATKTPEVEPDPRDPEVIARAEAKFTGGEGKDWFPTAHTTDLAAEVEATLTAPPEAVQEEESEMVGGIVHADPAIAALGAKQITDDIIATAWNRYIDNINYEVDQAKKNGKAGPWYLRNYVPAHVRVLCFRRDHPNGALITDMVEGPKGGFLATARVYLAAGDHREERYTDSGVEGIAAVTTHFRHAGTFVAMGRKTSREMENAETGAISRALGFMGYGAVASIATGEDVEEAKDQKRERLSENARHARELAERNRKAAAVKAAEKPREEPVRATVDDATQRAREKLIEFIGGKRILSRETFEEVFGPIDAMDRERVKEVGAKLVKIKTSAAWQKLCAKLKFAGRWKDYEGGTDLEQLRAYLFALVTVATDNSREHCQAALDAATKLVPFDDVEEEGAKIVATLAAAVNLTALEDMAEESRKAERA